MWNDEYAGQWLERTHKEWALAQFWNNHRPYDPSPNRTQIYQNSSHVQKYFQNPNNATCWVTWDSILSGKRGDQKVSIVGSWQHQVNYKNNHKPIFLSLYHLPILVPNKHHSSVELSSRGVTQKQDHPCGFPLNRDYDHDHTRNLYAKIISTIRFDLDWKSRT